MDLYRFELYAMTIISITLDACWISFHFDLFLFNIDFDHFQDLHFQNFWNHHRTVLDRIFFES